jgi:hypothetical protein
LRQFRRFDPHSHCFGFGAGELGQQGDDHAGLRLGGVELVLHGHEAAADAFEIVEELTDLPDATA